MFDYSFPVSIRARMVVKLLNLWNLTRIKFRDLRGSPLKVLAIPGIGYQITQIQTTQLKFPWEPQSTSHNLNLLLNDIISNQGKNLIVVKEILCKNG